MVRHAARTWLQQRVERALASRRIRNDDLAVALQAVEARAHGIQVALEQVERRQRALASDTAMVLAPFSAAMTMDQAWRRHPGAAAVFAAHHLPACDGCAVRFDESLEEAAAAYGLDLPRLLVTLNALLTPA